MDWKRKEGVTEEGGGWVFGEERKVGPSEVLLILFPKFCFNFFFPFYADFTCSMAFFTPQAARGLCTYLYMSSRHVDRIFNTADAQVSFMCRSIT